MCIMYKLPPFVIPVLLISYKHKGMSMQYFVYIPIYTMHKFKTQKKDTTNLDAMISYVIDIHIFVYTQMYVKYKIYKIDICSETTSHFIQS